jgi:hypothetical protein
MSRHAAQQFFESVEKPVAEFVTVRVVPFDCSLEVTSRTRVEANGELTHETCLLAVF